MFVDLKMVTTSLIFRVNDVPFSRQSSTTSNTSRDSKVQEELSKFDNLTISGRKLPKFQPPEVRDYFDIEVVMTATPDNFQVMKGFNFSFLLCD